MSSIGNSMDNMILYNNFFSPQSVYQDLNIKNDFSPSQQSTTTPPPLKKPPLSSQQSMTTRPPLKKPPVFRKPPPSLKKPVLKKPPVFRKPSPLSQQPTPNKSEVVVQHKQATHNNINPSVLVKRQHITKNSLQSKHKIKLPDSKYKSYDSHNYDIFVSNDGEILTMNNMFFVYRKSVNNYYNPQLSLQIYSSSTPKSYVVHTSKDEIFNIKITSNYNNLYDVLSTLSKYQMVNHPSEITFCLKHELLMEEYKFSILLHIIEDKLILDFSNNEYNTEWDDIQNILTTDIELTNNKIELPVSNIHNWDIILHHEGINLLQLRFEKDKGVYFSGKWCDEIFNKEEVSGKCDVCLRPDYF